MFYYLCLWILNTKTKGIPKTRQMSFNKVNMILKNSLFIQIFYDNENIKNL